MFTFIVENKYGQKLELTHNPNYDITEIDGLDPPEAIINTTRNANADGSVFNSSYVTDRQIIITLAINSPAEANRINLYKYFKSKFPVTLYYQNATRNVYINGYVKNIEIAFFDKKQIAQINVVCTNPLFSDVDENIIEFSSITSEFEFPFSIEESKNLLKNSMTSQTIDGITFTVADDGTVEASGTSTDYTWSAYIGTFVLESGDYILSGCPNGGSSTTYRLQMFVGNPSSPILIVNDYGDGASFTLTENTIVNVRILINGTVSNLTFEPMIRLASITDSSYQQYNNPNGLIEFSTITLHAEKSVVNNSDIDIGALITLKADGNVTNPIIYNTEDNTSFGLNVSMALGDEITINTRRKEKSVILTTAEGVQSNLIGAIAAGSTWFQLVPGDNVFIVTGTGSENLECTFTLINQYEGV